MHQTSTDIGVQKSQPATEHRMSATQGHVSDHSSNSLSRYVPARASESSDEQEEQEEVLSEELDGEQWETSGRRRVHGHTGLHRRIRGGSGTVREEASAEMARSHRHRQGSWQYSYLKAKRSGRVGQLSLRRAF